MSVGSRIAKNAGLLTLARGGTLALSFVTWAYLARVLSAEPLGQIGVGLALVSYFGLLVALGFDAVAMREVARRPDQLRRMVNEVIAMRGVLLLIAALVYLAVVAILDRPSEYKVVLLVAGAQLVARALSLDWVFIATEQIGVIAGRELGSAALMMAGTVAFVHGPEDVVLATAFVVGAPLLSTLAMWVSYRRRHGPVQPRVNVTAWRGLLSAGLPLAASALMIELFSTLDRLMLEGLRTTEEAGLYFGAYKVLAIALVPPSILYPVFFASLASTFGTKADMRKQGRTFARALLAFGVPIALAGPVLATGAIVLVNGPGFADAGVALAILLVNAGVVHVNAAIGTPLMAWNLQVPYMWAVVTGGVVNVVMNVALIPPFGIEGAAVATLVSEVVVGAGLLIVYRRATGDIPLGSLRRVVPATVIGALAPVALGSWLGWPTLVSAVVGLLSYAVATWIFGVVDRDWIRSVLRERFAVHPPSRP